MTPFEAVVLGFVQGVTEFLPVSSSGHLVMAQVFLDVPTPGVVVEVALHVATLLSVVLVYRQRLWDLGAGIVRRERAALVYVGLLLLATIPAGVVGVFFEDAIEASFDAPAVTGVMLIITGFLLWSTRWAARRRPVESCVPVPTVGSALAIGVAQAFAILPGISRSGATISTGMWAGVLADRAAEFSFLMSIPAIAGAALLQVGELGETADNVGRVALVSGFVVALITGVLAIRTLVWLLRKQRFHYFAFYTWAVGALFLLWLAVRA